MVQLDDLDKVRLRCKNHLCGAVVEADLSRLPTLFDPNEGFRCHVCNAEFYRPNTDSTNYAAEFAKSALALAALRDKVSVEFALRQLGTKPNTGP